MAMRRDTVFLPVEDAFDLSSEDELANEDEIPMEMDLTAAGPPISDDDTEFDNRLQGKQDRVVKLARHILPHIGLVVLLIIYLIVGATIFHYFELSHEMKTREHELNTIFGLRDTFHDNIWNLTRAGDNVISRESFNSIGQEYFEKLVTSMFTAYRNQFINERHLLNKTDGEELLWTYSNSIFFATTVITTIGYGNLVPATQLGRYACIAFALFGIPLLLVTIADIGKFLSDFLSFLYRNFRAFKRKKCAVRRNADKLRMTMHFLVYDASINGKEAISEDFTSLPRTLQFPIPEK
uniref:Ion_trans_2 domain-containing protein n=1 Tax=Steinernema glaseri TaxID=37863 RepID=A0A1I7ZJX8_9BILA